MSLYTGYLQDIKTSPNDQEFAAGDYTLSFTFSWPENEQIQYDNLQTNLYNAAHNEPLEDAQGNYVRDYDYIDYWLSVTEHTTLWPTSMRNLSEQGKQEYIEEKQYECLTLKELKDQYEELLQWNFVCTDGDKTTTGLLHLGGWFCYAENGYMFRFVSDKETIGQDDLKYVRIEVQTNDNRN